MRGGGGGGLKGRVEYSSAKLSIVIERAEVAL